MAGLADYGWNDDWSERLEACAATGSPARVVSEHRGLLRVRTEDGEIDAVVPGRLRHSAAGGSELPAVGDWVVVEHDGDTGRINHVLPRLSVFSRKVPGRRTREQVVGANIDTVWIVSPLDAERNPARVERYVTMAWESGASPVAVLTKSDLVEAVESIVAEMTERIVAVPVHSVSVVDGSGVAELRGYLRPGETIALLGPSGAGKSSLINCLAGREVMRTSKVREADGKGRHTTTHRQLVLLPDGGLVLDTPGMREIQLWGSGEGLERGFDDIEALARTCRFADCRHASEPGCAVREAVAGGRLDPERLESFRKLEKELAYLERRQDVRADLEERQRWKTITKEYRRWVKSRQ